MTTDFHTPWQDGVTQFKAVDMNSPLAELDEAIGNVSGEVVTVASNLSSHNHALNNLSEKNYSSLTSPPADDDFNSLTVDTSADDTDVLAIYDGAYKKITKANFLSGFSGSGEYDYNSLSELGSADGTDIIPIYDGAYKKITKANFLASIVSGEYDYMLLDEISSAGDSDAFPIYDGSYKRITKVNFLAGLSGSGEYDYLSLSEAGSAGDSDIFPIYDGTYKKITKANFLSGVTFSGEYDYNALSELGEAEDSDVIPIYDGAYKKVTRQTLLAGVGSLSGEFPYDIGITYPGKPTAGLVILRYPFPREVSFDYDMDLSQAVAGTAATAQTVFSLKKDGSEFATITFAISGTTGTFSGEATIFSAGEVLTLVCQNPADSTLADLGFALSGIREE